MFSVGGKNGNSGRESRKRFHKIEEDPPTLPLKRNVSEETQNSSILNCGLFSCLKDGEFEKLKSFKLTGSAHEQNTT